MFNASFKNYALIAMATTAIVAALTMEPCFAGGDGGGGRDLGAKGKAKVSTISSTDENGITTSIHSANGAPVYTITRTRGVLVLSKERKAKKSIDFVTIHNPDGTSRTITAMDR